MSYDITFFQFQNSYKGSIILQFGKNGASLQFVPVLNPVSPKDIKPGMKIYNYDASKWFTLTPDEMIIVRQVIPALIQNGLQGVNYKINTVEVSEKYGITITHFPRDGVSKVHISRFPDQKDPNKMHYMIRFTLNQNNQVVFDLGLEVGSHGLLLFQEYLSQQFNYMTTYSASMRAIYDANKPKNNYQNQNYQNQNNNTGGNRNYNNYQNSGNTQTTQSVQNNNQPEQTQQQNIPSAGAQPTGSVASLLG